MLFHQAGAGLLALLFDGGEIFALAARQFAEPLLLARLVAQVGDHLGLGRRQALAELMLQGGLVRVAAAEEQAQRVAFAAREVTVEQSRKLPLPGGALLGEPPRLTFEFAQFAVGGVLPFSKTMQFPVGGGDGRLRCAQLFGNVGAGFLALGQVAPQGVDAPVQFVLLP